MLLFLKITVLSIGAGLFLVGTISGIVWLVFRYSPKQTGRVSARLVDTRHKKNVTTYGFGHAGGGLRVTGFIKNLTKAKYHYVLQGKTYRIRDDYIGTPRQTPMFVSVVYLRRFPRLAYIDSLTSLGSSQYGLHALICFVMSVSFLNLGFFI